MGHKFKVGELAVASTFTAGVIECEINALPQPRLWINPRTLCKVRPGFYSIRGSDGEYYQVQESQLRKKPGHDDDSRQVTTWANCLWQPQGAKV